MSRIRDTLYYWWCVAVVLTWRPPAGIKLTVYLSPQRRELSVVLQGCCTVAVVKELLATGLPWRVHDGLDAMARKVVEADCQDHVPTRFGCLLTEAERAFHEGLARVRGGADGD